MKKITASRKAIFKQDYALIVIKSSTEFGEYKKSHMFGI